MKKLLLLLLFVPLIAFGQIISRNDLVKRSWGDQTSGSEIYNVFEGNILEGSDPFALTIEGKASYTPKCEQNFYGEGGKFVPEFKRTFDYDSYKIVCTEPVGEDGCKSGTGEVISIYLKERYGDILVGITKHWVFDVESLYFQGLVGDIIIIDSGTGPERYIQVFDLKKKEFVYGFFSSGYLKFLDNKFYFDEEISVSSKKGTPGYDFARNMHKVKCSEELKRYGTQSIGYYEKVIFDLSSLELKRTGVYECAYVQ